jgi:hypothetical protein
MGNDDQRPMFYGEMKGNISLMHYAPRKAKSTANASPSKSKSVATTGSKWVSSSDKWLMLDDHFYTADRVRHTADGSIEVEIAKPDADQEATLRHLKRSGLRSRDIPFAYGNDANDVSVTEVTSEATAKGQTWTLKLKPGERRSGFFGVTHMEGNRSYTPDDIAGLRARYILLKEPPAGYSPRSSWTSQLWQNDVVQPHDGTDVSGVIAKAYASFGKQRGKWRQLARLRAMYFLRATGTIEDVLKLAIGTPKKGKVHVSFKGRCPKRASNVDPALVEFEGECPL